MSSDASNSTNRPLSKEALAAIPVLRSLIISEKETSTLKRILNDYCKEEGEPLPFRKFGFPSAVEYLKATGEFVLRTHMGETMIFVKPKSDTAHIQKMVAAQKPAKGQQKRNNAYHWKNPQLRQSGQMSKPQPAQNNPNNPLKRFFPSNSTTYYPKVSLTNENVPPKPSIPPSYARPTTAVKVEPRERKPIVMNAPPKMNENVPPLPANIMQQAYVRPMPNNNYTVKRESPPLAGLPIQSGPKNPCKVENQFSSYSVQNDRFVHQPINTGIVPNQQNQFKGNLQCPPGFNYRQPASSVMQFTPSNYNIPSQSQYQGQNIQYNSNHFRTNYQQQQRYPNNASRIPFAALQQQQQQQVSSDQTIYLLYQQVQMLHDSVKTFKNSYQQSRSLFQSNFNQDVEMMEAIVWQFQQSVTNNQQRQRVAVDRLNQKLEYLHATCHTSGH